MVPSALSGLRVPSFSNPTLRRAQARRPSAPLRDHERQQAMCSSLKPHAPVWGHIMYWKGSFLHAATMNNKQTFSNLFSGRGDLCEIDSTSRALGAGLRPQDPPSGSASCSHLLPLIPASMSWGFAHPTPFSTTPHPNIPLLWISPAGFLEPGCCCWKGAPEGWWARLPRWEGAARARRLSSGEGRAASLPSASLLI